MPGPFQPRSWNPNHAMQNSFNSLPSSHHHTVFRDSISVPLYPPNSPEDPVLGRYAAFSRPIGADNTSLGVAGPAVRSRPQVYPEARAMFGPAPAPSPQQRYVQVQVTRRRAPVPRMSPMSPGYPTGATFRSYGQRNSVPEDSGDQSGYTDY